MMYASCRCSCSCSCRSCSNSGEELPSTVCIQTWRLFSNMYSLSKLTFDMVMSPTDNGRLKRDNWSSDVSMHLEEMRTPGVSIITIPHCSAVFHQSIPYRSFRLSNVDSRTESAGKSVHNVLVCTSAFQSCQASQAVRPTRAAWWIKCRLSEDRTKCGTTLLHNTKDRIAWLGYPFVANLSAIFFVPLLIPASVLATMTALLI